MPGIELPDERRFLFLSLIFTLALGYVYYFQPSPPFVERFERAYYDVYWNRPLVQTTNDGPAVGIIAPRYISSLVDTEIWLWVQNTTDRPITATIVITQTTMVWPPIEDVADAPTPTPLPAGQPTPTPTPRPAGTPVIAQVLMREGEGRGNLHADSRTTVHFSSLMPGETAARLLWTRVMPIAQLSVTAQNKQGEDENLLPVYLYDSDISLGEVTFTYALWLKEPSETIILEQHDDDPPTAINSQQAVMRGFVRTLLLPPWSNGLLVGLALICAFIVNGLVAIFEQRLLERQAAHRTALERGAAPDHHPQPVYPFSFREAVAIVVRSHPFIWVTQLLFWVTAIPAGIALTVALTERLVLCPLVAAGQALDGTTDCPLWPAGTVFIRLGLLALFFFYCGYLANDLTPGSLRNHLLHFWHEISGGEQVVGLTLDKDTTTANFDQVGDTIAYTYKVTNSGNVPLTPPYAVSDNQTTVICPQTPNPLNPGDFITCSASYEVTQADITTGSVVNVATATAKYGQNTVLSNQHTVTVPAVQTPTLSLDKDTTTVNYHSVGDTISYSYKVTNSGNVPVTPPYAVSDNKATVTCPQTPNPLMPGAFITCTASYTVTQADLDAGSVVNIATASATFNGNPVTSNQGTVTVRKRPGPTDLEKRRATRLSNKAGDLLAECDNTLLPSLPLDEIRQRAAQLRLELYRLQTEAAQLPSALWNTKAGAAHLKALQSKLDGVDEYVAAAETVAPPLRTLGRGDPAAAGALRQQRDDLRTNQALNEEPARGLADALIQQLETGLREYDRRFVSLWRGVDNDAALVAALEELEAIGNPPNGSLRVRFFTSPDDIANNDHDIMPARQALDYGRARLQKYREQRLAKQEARFDEIHSKRPDAILDEDQAWQQYQALLNDIRDWPNALPGWQRFPPDDPAALASRVSQLRDRVNAERP